MEEKIPANTRELDAESAAINKALQAIGKRFFVTHFADLTNTQATHSDIARRLSEQHQYAFAACKVRVNKSRKLLANFNASTVMSVLVATSRSMDEVALNEAKRLLQELNTNPPIAKTDTTTTNTAPPAATPKTNANNKPKRAHSAKREAIVEPTRATSTNRTTHTKMPAMLPGRQLVQLQQLRHNSIKMLPNFFTLCGLFFGFLSIVLAMRNEHLFAMYCIALAAFFDGIDGKIARMTNVASKFGVELDSIADMVSFGVAPAIFLLSSGLGELGNIGWAIAFFYVIAAALRLARFNVLANEGKGSGFLGLPSPAAAGVVVLTFLMLEHLSFPADEWWRTVVIAVITVLVACSMMSSFSYGKVGFLIAPLRPFWRSVLIAVMLALAIVDYLVFPCLVVLMYWLVVPMTALVRRVRT